VRVSTLRGAVDAGLVGDPVELPATSWGSGKDWRVWAGEQVADVVALNDRVQQTVLDTGGPGPVRDPRQDAMAQEALLALSSDWAFMISKDSAPDYARRRAETHAAAVATLAARRPPTLPPHPFGHLDARALFRRERSYGINMAEVDPISSFSTGSY
jgi:1,4-alpha-glucan branching enzyme